MGEGDGESVGRGGGCKGEGVGRGEGGRCRRGLTWLEEAGGGGAGYRACC